MATLPTEDTNRISRGLMRFWSRTFETVPVSKLELYNSVVATDEWIDANAASFNNALPVGARTALSLAQKTLIFCAVALARVSIPFLRAVLGEVD